MFAKTQIAQPSLPPIMALAWAAGLTDGDGCVHIAKQTFSDPWNSPSSPDTTLSPHEFVRTPLG